MLRLNRFLFVLLTFLVVLSAVGSVIASDGNGTLDFIEDYDDEDSEVVGSDEEAEGSLDLIEEFEDDTDIVNVLNDSDSNPNHTNPNHSSPQENSGNIPLNVYHTGNPLVLLLASLALVGFSSRMYLK